jgi:type IV pilus assembly protein PilM
MGRGVWGIDVSKFSVKAVRIEAGPAGMVLTQVGVMPYEGTDSGEPVNLDSEIRHSLAELKVRLKIGSEKVVLSLPGHSTFNRLIKLPPVQEGKLEEVVRYEAQSQIPFPIDEVIWDYQLVDRPYAPGEEKEVILFAIKKEIVEQFLANIADLGLNVEAIQFAPVALFNFLTYDQDIGSSSIAIDMGADNADLLIVDGAKFWIRNLPITGNDITKALQKAFKVSFAEAEKLKRKAASTPQAQKIFNAAQPVIRDLIGEVHRSIGYYKSISKQVRFEKVLVLGNASRFVNFQKFVSQTLQMPAVRVTKLNRIAIGGSLDAAHVAEDLTTISTSLGLALQGWGESNNKVNLLPAAFKKSREMKRKQPLVAVAAAGLIALVGTMWVMADSEAKELGDKAAQAKALTKEITEQRAKFDEAKAELAKIETPLKRLESMVRERDTLLQVMNRIHPNIPDNGNPTVARTKGMWILDWEVEEQPMQAATSDRPASGSRPSAVVGREWDPNRKLRIRMEVAVVAGSRDRASASNLIRSELLGVTTDKFTDKQPHRLVQGKRSVVKDMNLQVVTTPPLFAISVKERTDELKPSKPFPPGSAAPSTSATGKYWLADVILEIPLNKAPEKPAEPAKKPAN